MLQTQGALARLFGPMNIAGYATWVAVFVLLHDTPVDRFGETRALAFICVIGFLLVLILREILFPVCAGLCAWSLLALEGAFALGACAFWPETLSPILLVVFMAECGMVLGAAALVTTGVVLNLGLWWIAAELWEMKGAWRLLLAYVGFQVFATLTAWYARRTERSSKELREANAHLLATRSLLEESARDRERLLLARELHDVAGHKLTALKLNLTALQRESADAPLVNSAAQLATELLADIRGVVSQMRVHDGLDVRAALAQLVAPFPAPPTVHLAVAEDALVENVEQAQALMRAVQEGITNVVRHAGARNAWIELRREGGAIKLTIRDDGKAVLPLEEGFGLSGMRERITQLSGTLRTSRGAEGGVVLDIDLPLAP